MTRRCQNLTECTEWHTELLCASNALEQIVPDVQHRRRTSRLVFSLESYFLIMSEHARRGRTWVEWQQATANQVQNLHCRSRDLDLLLVDIVNAAGPPDVLLAGSPNLAV